MTLAETALAIVVVLPGLVFAAIGIAWLLGVPLAERILVRMTAATFIAASLGVAAIAWNGVPVTVHVGGWFSAGEYHFAVDLVADSVSLPFVGLTVLLTGLVGSFSARYMHRERGFVRFFALLHLFAFGALVLFTSGSFDLIVAGWELLGVTSVLLVAFFQQREDPVRNALRVFLTYRLCDIGLLLAVVVMHHAIGSTALSALGGASQATTEVRHLIAFLLVLAAAGKSAQVPFTGWLPRAMEGPTPSSAIFYGAIAVHAGVFLLLRARPILEGAPLALAGIAIMGGVTAVLATLAGRACTDAKTSLAFASASQVGLVFLEIGLGFWNLAVWHVCGHAAVRTLQFLRAPSALHEYHLLHAAAGGDLKATGLHYEAMLPAPVRLWLYRMALDRGHVEGILERFVVGPVLTLSRRLNRLEPRMQSAREAGDV